MRVAAASIDSRFTMPCSPSSLFSRPRAIKNPWRNRIRQGPSRVDDALGRRPAQAELAIIIAAAMLIPMRRKMAVIVRVYIGFTSL